MSHSGGLIGESIDESEYEGDIEETPVFLGCSNVDPHIPEERVHVTASVFERLNGDVEERIYEGMGHGVNEDELAYVSSLTAASSIRRSGHRDPLDERPNRKLPAPHREVLWLENSHVT